jgi:DnaJ-class molecular chaperone
MYTKEIQPDVCAECVGTGYVPHLEVVNCPICHGSGRFMDSPCLGCGGHGAVELDGEALCPSCDAAGSN